MEVFKTVKAAKWVMTLHAIDADALAVIVDDLKGMSCGGLMARNQIS